MRNTVGIRAGAWGVKGENHILRIEKETDFLVRKNATINKIIDLSICITRDKAEAVEDDDSEDEGIADYKISGYHPIYIG